MMHSIHRRSDPMKEESQTMEVDDTTDDRELPAENNGPIRFPYVSGGPQAQSHDHTSWDEDDAQVGLRRVIDAR